MRHREAAADPGGGDVQLGRTRGETMRHREAAGDPGGGDVQLGRTRGETARHREAAGHGLLSLMAAREGIGHILFHQAPPLENPPPSHTSGERAFDAELVC